MRKLNKAERVVYRTKENCGFSEPWLKKCFISLFKKKKKRYIWFLLGLRSENKVRERVKEQDTSTMEMRQIESLFVLFSYTQFFHTTLWVLTLQKLVSFEWLSFKTPCPITLCLVFSFFVILSFYLFIYYFLFLLLVTYKHNILLYIYSTFVFFIFFFQFL